MGGEEETKKEAEQPIENADLYIGVKSDLTPFNIDLKALTRGLVVVGQSGCGKSFLLGRIVEEIISKTTDKTRLVIIDPNSDFAYGTALENEESFMEKVDRYQSGFLNKEFKKFKADELKAFRELKQAEKLAPARVFGKGRGDPFDLSWGWTSRPDIYLQVIKANEYSRAYNIALELIREATIKPEALESLKHWNELASHLAERLRLGNETMSKLGKYCDMLLNFEILNVIDEFKHFVVVEAMFELYYDLDLGKLQDVWKDGPASGDGLLQSVVCGPKANIVEVETLQNRTLQLKVLLALLLWLWEHHFESIEKCRLSIENAAENEKNKNELKHTFILIDEAHNFAPNEPTNAHEKVLGELIYKIAAEGRKYGLHLILATQRPNKVKRGLLGECDNAIIMKMNSRSDLEHLANEMRILDVKLLEPALHFQSQGNAIAIGEMTRMAPFTQIFKSAPRRTKEGGVDIKGF